MSPLALSTIAFAGIFGGAGFGKLVRAALPVDHLSPDSKDVIKLAMGLIATMAALVLGLLTASAQGTFKTWDGEIKQSAANIILLDRSMAHYGSETQALRAQLRASVASRLAETWPEDGSAGAGLDGAGVTPTVEGIDNGIRALTPQTDAQRGLQARAAQLSSKLMATRWLLLAQSDVGIPMPLLVILVSWLSALFASFGLFAPRNATVTVALLLSALAVSASIFLILELSSPMSGLLKVSSEPLRYALSQLGQ